MTDTADNDKSMASEIPADHRVVEIPQEPVELYKILKFEGLASSGGEAKSLVASGQVLVNYAVERQKRKKIGNGDMIEFNNEKIYIQLAIPAATDAELKPSTAEVESDVNAEEDTANTSVDQQALISRDKEEKKWEPTIAWDEYATSLIWVMTKWSQYLPKLSKQ